VKKLITIIFILISFNAISAESIKKNAEQLNKKTHELLGISPRALGFLLEATPGSFYPAVIYKQNGGYKYFEELERNGYVTLKIVGGLPDRMSNETMVQLIPSKKGEVVKCALMK